MAAPLLSVVAGERPRDWKTKATQPAPQDAIAKRWRHEAEPETAHARQDVIPLLDGWVRVLEKQASSYPISGLR